MQALEMEEEVSLVGNGRKKLYMGKIGGRKKTDTRSRLAALAMNPNFLKRVVAVAGLALLLLLYSSTKEPAVHVDVEIKDDDNKEPLVPNPTPASAPVAVVLDTPAPTPAPVLPPTDSPTDSPVESVATTNPPTASPTGSPTSASEPVSNEGTTDTSGSGQGSDVQGCTAELGGRGRVWAHGRRASSDAEVFHGEWAQKAVSGCHAQIAISDGASRQMRNEPPK